MSGLGIATPAPDKMVQALTSYLNEGNIEEAVALLADQFSFKDHAIRLEFNTKDRLAEFFRKARELYPDSLLQTETIVVSGSNALTEWTFQTNSIDAAFGNCRRKVPISLQGASVVRTENARITSSSDQLATRMHDGTVRGVLVKEIKLKELRPAARIDPNRMWTDRTPLWFAGGRFDFAPRNRQLIQTPESTLTYTMSFPGTLPKPIPNPLTEPWQSIGRQCGNSPSMT
jgi:steroid delta-isomerase-like uncharacterized protein